jgi:hypothetical protein
MKIRAFVFAPFLLLLYSSLRAQRFIGLEGGVSYNVYASNISNRTSTAMAGGTGYQLDIPIRYAIRPWLYAETAPGILRKDHALNRTDSLVGAFERFDNSYLQLPIGVSLVYGRRLRLSLDPGVYLGYWLSGRQKGSVADIFGVTDSSNALGQVTERFPLAPFNDKVHFLSQRDNRWEFGWVAGLGAQYRLGGNYWLTAAAKYCQALTSQEKTGSGQAPGYNQSWIFSVGGSYAFGKSYSAGKSYSGKK